MRLHGAVTIISGSSYDLVATVRGTRAYRVELTRRNNTLLAGCTCPYFETDGLCKHIWGVLLVADGLRYLKDSNGQLPNRISEMSIAQENEPEFLAASPKPKPALLPANRTIEPWQQALRQVKILSAPEHRGERVRADRQLYYVIDRTISLNNQVLYMEITHRERKKNGDWGKLKTARFSRRSIYDLPDAADREILSILAGIPDPGSYYIQDSVPFAYRLSGAMLNVVVPRICATGRCTMRINASVPLEQQTPLAWDDGPPWELRLNVRSEHRHWAIRGELVRGDVTMDLTKPDLLTEEGVLIADGLVSRLSASGYFGWIPTLRREGKIEVPLTHGPKLIEELLDHEHVPPVDWPDDLRFEEVTLTPKPRLQIREVSSRWTGPALHAFLSFDYDGLIVADDFKPTGIYQPDRKRLIRRDRAAEDAAGDLLGSMGMRIGNTPWDEQLGRDLPASKLPMVVRDLLRAGWHVETDGKLLRQHGAVRAEISSGIDWFELHAVIDYGGAQATLPELLKAIKRGESMVRLSDGSFGLVPEEFMEQYGFLIGAGKAQGDHVRFSHAQTGLLDALLLARPDVQIDAVFARARDQIMRFERIEPAPQPAGFHGELRLYQREGLAWMKFLEQMGFGGCLADDMGVGKTPQVLALLETRREERETDPRIGPSLCVLPRSLIYNWKQEAARFTPQLRVLDHSGASRGRPGESFDGFDLILTTYGTLRRDAAAFRDIRFDYAILDEAQAIKNADSESAKAARLLNADHRIAMSGTPIENHLGELWSLFEFLNPGMLGSLSMSPVGARALRNPDEETRQVLARALRPFILRRTKDQVAPELPKKLEQTIYCELDAVQRKLYNELRDHYRMSLLGRIDSRGLAQSKMQILEALLRLRQAACHPGLLDVDRFEESSAKLEVLLPQLEEVTEEGHKALVFSQFTSLLAIVRDRLDKDKIDYEYLDGKTRDRQSHVERFQNDPNCKLFLISLKAGGVGLNLTAAEYVFLLDPWWNPAVEAQAIDRTHRIGQEKPVFAYRLIAKNTVEEKVLELQETKRNLADSIIRADTNLVRNLKREDLEFLFS